MQVPDPDPRPLDHLSGRGAPDAPALITRDGVIDYAGLEARVGVLSASLAKRFGPGERIASWLPKGLMTSLLPLACARAGLVHVPINPLLKRAQAAHILADSGAVLLVSGAARLAGLQAGDVPKGCDPVAEAEGAVMLSGGERLPPSRADPDSLAALLYTSGSTGRPKGVMLSHANLWLGAIGVAHYLELAPEDRTLAVLPFSFDYGQNQLFSTWAAGGCVVPLEYLTPRDLVAAVDRHRITTLAGVPPLWLQLAETGWPAGAGSSIRRLTNSGGHLPAAVVRRLRERLPAAKIFLMYGLTEAFRSTWLHPSLVDDHPGSIGTAVPFAEIMIVGENGECAEEGELVHGGPLVAKGYWNDPSRTAERFRPAPHWSASGGTAVWSGDRVRRDGDGLLYFLGRDDAMIKTSGNRVSPTEIEEAALASGIAAEAAAFGVPDDRLGQAIALVVRGEREREPELRRFFKSQLPNFMQPGRILWRNELPVGANGKLDREHLKRELIG